MTLQLFFEINFVIIHESIVIKALFYQLLIAMNIDVEVLVELDNAFKGFGLFLYRSIRNIKAIGNSWYQILLHNFS